MNNEHANETPAREQPAAAELSEPNARVVNNDARQAAQLIPVGRRGVEPQDFAQVADRSRWMAQAKEAVPAHLRNNVGMCVAIHEMALEWGFRPYGVANLCYVVNNRLGFEAQLWVAVVNKHGNLTERLRPEYEGEGADRVCVVRGHFRDEAHPCVYRSPRFSDIKPKNSPLWAVDPDRQQWYYSARAFVRIFCPHVMLGIFGADELLDNPPHVGFDAAKDVTPDPDPGERLHERLQAAAAQNGGAHAEGFREGAVDLSLAESPQEGATEPVEAVAEEEGMPDRARAEKRTSGARAAKAGQPAGKKPPKPAKAPAKARESGAAKPRDDDPPRTATLTPKDAMPGPETVKAAADRAQERAARTKADQSARTAEPTNPTEYREHVIAWLRSYEDEAECEARWASELKLRRACGVGQEQRLAIRSLVDDRVAELKR